MMGRVKSLSKFGLFVDFGEPRQTGLLRWSALAREHGKFQRSDLIDIEILKIHEDGKIELKQGNRSLLEVLEDFSQSEQEKLEALTLKNQELLKN